MRYFLACFALLVVVVVSVAGFRGSRSRRPPIELIPDMVRQPKLRPQTPNEFFADAASSRLPVAGTVARGTPFEATALNTGRIPGTTNFVVLNPLPITAELLRRGQERYQIHCAPCHGPLGDGKGITTKYGMAVIADLHDVQARKVVQMPDGQLFDALTNGKNLMQGYGPNLAIPDRWAIVAYVRALQLSHLGTEADVPAEHRAALKK